MSRYLFHLNLLFPSTSAWTSTHAQYAFICTSVLTPHNSTWTFALNFTHPPRHLPLFVHASTWISALTPVTSNYNFALNTALHGHQSLPHWTFPYSTRSPPPLLYYLLPEICNKAAFTPRFFCILLKGTGFILFFYFSKFTIKTVCNRTHIMHVPWVEHGGGKDLSTGCKNMVGTGPYSTHLLPDIWSYPTCLPMDICPYFTYFHLDICF